MAENQTPSEMPTCWPVPWRQYATKCICKPQCPTPCPLPIEEPPELNCQPSQAQSQAPFATQQCTTPMSHYVPPPQFSEPPKQDQQNSFGPPPFRPPQCFDQQQCQYDQFDQFEQQDNCQDNMNFGASGQCQPPPMQNEQPPVMCYMPRGPQS